jgi:hypothetical protein
MNSIRWKGGRDTSKGWSVMSFGMGSEKSSAEMNQNVWGGQSPFLQALYQGAQALQRQQGGQVPGAANRYAQEGLGGAGAGMASMMDIARTGGPVGQYANPNNALAKEQLSQMSTNIGQNFQRNVMPALNSAAGVAGGLGGSRNAIGRGLAASDAQQQIAQAGTNLYGHQYDIGAQAAAQATQARMGAAGALPGMGQDIYNLGLSPFSAQWAPYTALAQMLGSPVSLASSRQSGKKSQFNLGLF